MSLILVKYVLLSLIPDRQVHLAVFLELAFELVHWHILIIGAHNSIGDFPDLD